MTSPVGKARVNASASTPQELFEYLGANDTASWSGTGSRLAGADELLASAGLKPISETNTAVLITPLLGWLLPLQPPAYIATNLRPIYVDVARASVCLAQRRDLLGATKVLHGLARQLRLELDNVATEADGRDVTFRDVYGWLGSDRDSLLHRVVSGLIRENAIHRQDIAAATDEHNGWSNATVDVAAITRLVVAARAGNWPGWTLLVGRLAQHPLYQDACELNALLDRPRSELAAFVSARTRPGRSIASTNQAAAPSDTTAALAMVLVLAHHARVDGLVQFAELANTNTNGVAVFDAALQLAGIGLDLVGEATVPQALGALVSTES